MNNKTIFIHSLFRTGSTYVWNKFRKSDTYHCYYEPFHQALTEIEVEKPTVWSYDHNTTQSLHHPDLDKFHTHEYLKLLQPGIKGVPHFKKPFSFDDFCNNGDNTEQKEYIDYLIKGATGKIPLFQFNRSALRINWFKKYYPGAVHIYLVRDPRSQFHSYVSMWEKNNLPIFLVMDLLIASKNRESKYFKACAQQIPLFKYNAPQSANEIAFYSRLLRHYSHQDRYNIFYTIWFSALIENALTCDLFLNIDLLSTDTAYREQVAEQFNSHGIESIDFSDSRVSNYQQPILKIPIMSAIEEDVQAILLKEYSRQEIDQIVAHLGAENRENLKISTNSLQKLREKSPGINQVDTKQWEKYQSFIESICTEIGQQEVIIQDLQKQVTSRDQQINQQAIQLQKMAKELEHKSLTIKRIVNSIAFRVGKFIVQPFSRIISKKEK